MPMIWFFVALLGVSLVQGIVFISLARQGTLSESLQLGLILLLEGVDTFLVLLAVCVLPRPAPPPSVEPMVQKVTWIFAAPLLLVLLGINYAYHNFLQQFIDGGSGDVTFGLPPFSPLLILIICVQPAIVEEVFFRHLALGLLRRQMGIHVGVLVSSIMFAVAHLFNPLSMPILGLLGLALGYLRIYSRHLLLPILMHFLHNFAVIWLMTR
jgi:membrane protease YdiL (CAAX protease family)